MADQVRITNPFLRYGTILVVVIGVFAWTYFQEKKQTKHSGTIEYRMVTGQKNGQFQVILLETADRYVILDSTFREALVTEDGELISRPKQLLLLEKYQNIDYRVGFNEEPSGLKTCYRVTRELFNSLRFGTKMPFEVNKKQPDTLIE